MKLLKDINSGKFWSAVDFNRYGISSFLLVTQSCLGSVAVCYIMALPTNNIQLFLLVSVAISTMLANAGIISLLPMKWNIRLFFISLSISILSLLYTLI